MASIATFGEIMLRLSPPGKEPLFQSPQLRAVFGGGEANVAVSLAIWGHRSRWISVVPANPVGEAALRELRRYGVDVGAVVRGGRRLGIYFAETGANERPSQVLYDREGSGIAEAGPGAVDWAAALEGMEGLHVTGITPALSASAAALTLEAVRAARARGMAVSLDLNYRSKLWRYGRPAPEVMRELAGLADTVMGNEEDCQKALGLGDAPGLAAGRIDVARA
jgi:2-dehydro-3-deoxygluconokinase